MALLLFTGYQVVRLHICSLYDLRRMFVMHSKLWRCDYLGSYNALLLQCPERCNLVPTASGLLHAPIQPLCWVTHVKP